MATTIKSTQLDFTNIKNSLKQYLASKTEFADYNFEASGLSNILDVLAYNTHYNALIANFAMNESYLGTAQLRSSIVSLAEALGYIPGSMASSEAVLSIKLNLTGETSKPNIITIPSGKKFTAPVDGYSFTFQTQEALVAYDDGTGMYEFKNLQDSTNIVVYEGSQKVKRFVVGAYEENSTYVIPDNTLNLDSVVVRVYDSPLSSVYNEYTNIISATEVVDTSRLYYIKETPNGYYEITFGNGNTMGMIPSAGNVIEVSYLSSNGDLANGAFNFSEITPLSVNGTSHYLTIATISASAGGSQKEDIESIRKNAPFQFAAQNRMITAGDYTSTIYRNFPTIIKDIRAYGGEEAPEPKYGVIFLSVLFNGDVSEETILSTKAKIKDIVSKFAVVSFGVEFIEPLITYIETTTYFQYNPSLTNLSVNNLQNLVGETVSGYFDDNTGKFERSFRRSNMLTLVDEVNASILSSRCDVRMQQRIVPVLGIKNEFVLTFPQSIMVPDDVNLIVTSSLFYSSGKACVIQNKLGTNKLQLVAGAEVIIDNVGYYESSTGKVVISGLILESIITGDEYIKVSVVPSNQSAIVPTVNGILEYDILNSTANAVPTNAVN